MLPKIPYKMEKNKSQSIPMRSINLGPAAEAGELSDSLGISTRKFPYLTVRRGDLKLDEYESVKAMTVFGGELVTVREDGIYIGDELVTQIGSEEDNVIPGEKHFAPINSKLVIFPNKKYIQKDDENWSLSSLPATVNVKSAEFSSNSIALTETYYEIASGQGCKIKGKEFNIDIQETLYDNAWVFIGDNVNGTIYSDRKEISILKSTENEYLYLEDKHVRILFVDNRLEFIKNRYGARVTTVKEFCKNNKIESGSRIFVKTKDYADIDNVYVVDSIYAGYIVVKNIDGSYPNWSDTKVNVSLFVKNNENLITYLQSQSWKAINIEYKGESAKYWLEYANGIFVLHGNYDLFTSKFYQLSLSSIGWDVKFTDSLIKPKIQNTHKIIITSGNRDVFPITFEKDENEEINQSQILASENISESEITVTPGKETDGIVKIWGVRNNSDDLHLGLSAIKKGDTVTIEETDSNDMAFTISDIKGTTIYAGANIFNALTANDFAIKRNIPHLDFICEKDNRLYGVNNSEKTIYVSALGDPTNMYTYEGVSTDSFAVAVGSEGDFTACCKYGEAVLFFKEDMLYKLVGSSPLDFALYSYNVAGVEAGSEKSCVVINEVLYYKGRQGVYAYTGGVPVLISECFGERRFSEGVGGTDGRYYYLSVIDEEKKPYLFTYDTRTQLWLIEENVRCVDFARTRDGLYYAGEDGCVYAVGSGQPSGEWLARWAPIYELIDGKRSYSRILVRVSLPRGSYIIVKIRCDGGEWREAGKIVGKTEAVVPIRIPINRCDKFELELSGKGECTILDIMREFYVGSEV